MVGFDGLSLIFDKDIRNCFAKLIAGKILEEQGYNHPKNTIVIIKKGDDEDLS